MNLKKLSTEQLQTIIDNAPKWAVWYVHNHDSGVDYLGAVLPAMPVTVLHRGNKTETSADHCWYEVVDSGSGTSALKEIKSELKSRLEIDSNRPEPFTIKTQAETLVTISNIRTWQGTPEQFDKHQKAIIHWCGGVDIEKEIDKDYWCRQAVPMFKL